MYSSFFNSQLRLHEELRSGYERKQQLKEELNERLAQNQEQDS